MATEYTLQIHKDGRFIHVDRDIYERDYKTEGWELNETIMASNEKRPILESVLEFKRPK
jgi:hypothetical protein